MILKPADLRPHQESQTLLINQQSLERIQKGEQVYRFGFGQSPFPVPAEISSVLAESAGRKEYMSVQGYPDLRRAIAEFHSHTENKQWDADQIVVGAGSKILIFCLLAAFKRAEVVIPAPSWVSYEPQANLAGLKVSWIETSIEDKWLVTAERLREFCLARADSSLPLVLILNYPSNPTGQTYTRSQLQELASVLSEFEVIVIADEIYSLLTYSQDYATLDEFYPQGTIVSSGMSKWCGAGGWRLGFVHIPAALGELYFKTVVGIASETYSCAASPIQLAAVAAYSGPQLARDFLDKQIALLVQVSNYCSAALSGAGVKVHSAQGGFYLFPDFSPFAEKLKVAGVTSSDELTRKLLLDTGVALLPGSAFGMSPESLTARLAFVDFDGSQILDRDHEEIEFDRVKQGIGEIVGWLQKVN
jgi:aspartate aminotransferase